MLSPASQLLLHQLVCSQLPTPQLRDSKLLIKQVPLRELQPGGRELMESGIIPLQARGHLFIKVACAVAACNISHPNFLAPSV